MKMNKPWMVAITLLVLTAAPALLSAQNEQTETNGRYPRYRLIDVGTFGGPTSYASADFIGARTVNNRGIATGAADTSTPDPTCFNVDCFISHVFHWQGGNLVDLGALPGGNSSNASEINERGDIVGLSSNGKIDPLTGFPEARAVLWRDGKMINLCTLGGTESLATAINDRGLVIGASANTVPDPFSMFGFGTQTRTFVWENGVMRDIGTLGGPDATPFGRNNRGQVSGSSYTGDIPNPDTGQPTVHPFLWQDRRMTDLGSLGGTLAYAEGLNNRGQVIGLSSLKGNLIFHPFLWERGVLKDLGTLGGDNGDVSWINDAGQIVRYADLPGSQTHNAFLWERGVMTDLGNLGQSSRAFAINSRGQVVGSSRTSDGSPHAFLWEKGRPMIDLNVFIPEGASLEQLTDAININDRGEIMGVGFPVGVPQDNLEIGGHVFLLIPCHDDSESCRDAGTGRIAVTDADAFSNDSAWT
jgi:probable HAF family extracellular repeat protein